MSTFEPDTITERAALVAWHLAHGEQLETVQVAAMTGLTRQGAWHLMQRLSRVLPIYQSGDAWQVCILRELEYAGIDP